MVTEQCFEAFSPSGCKHTHHACTGEGNKHVEMKRLQLLKRSTASHLLPNESEVAKHKQAAMMTSRICSQCQVRVAKAERLQLNPTRQVVIGYSRILVSQHLQSAPL